MKYIFYDQKNNKLKLVAFDNTGRYDSFKYGPDVLVLIETPKHFKFVDYLN